MAKRFGRNQKRKMREEIDRLSRSESNALVKANNLEGRLCTWAQSMRQCLGKQHALNEEIERILLHREPYLMERYRFSSPQAIIYDLLDRRTNNVSVSMSYIEAVLHVVRTRRDEVRPAVIAELIAPDKQLYYAIDESFLEEGRKDPRFIQWIAEELAHKLAKAQ